MAASLLLPVLQISGTSMTDTLQNEDIVVAVNSSKFKTGDVVAFYYNNNILIKRVIATGGQTVDLQDGRVLIDGVPLTEPYTDGLPSYPLTPAYGSSLVYPYTVRDSVAAEGLVDGAYQTVELTHPEGYLWIRITAGDKLDARCTVEATRADPDKLRFFRTKMPPRQAAAWLLGYPHGEYLPGGKEWKDFTKQVK